MGLSRSYQLARTLTLIEEREFGWQDALAGAYAVPQRAELVGLAGAPGVGKSTLIDCLAVGWAERGEKVAILAVDPSSRFSSGALLGDRIRMHRSVERDGVYVRSVASRSQTGGLAAAIPDFCVVLNQFGFDRIVIETIGTGQVDTALRDQADCVLAIVAPSMGDDVQAVKAGWMEIGDIFVVNKYDLAGSDQADQILHRHLSALYPGEGGINSALPSSGRNGATAVAGAPWRRDWHGDPQAGAEFWHPPVLRTVAQTGEGVDAVAETVGSFMAWLQRSGRAEIKRRARARAQIATLVADRIAQWARVHGVQADDAQAWVDAVLGGRMTPHAAADAIVADLGLSIGSTNRKPGTARTKGRR